VASNSLHYGDHLEILKRINIASIRQVGVTYKRAEKFKPRGG